MFAGRGGRPAARPTSRPAVFERLLTLASELGLEGREGRPVGTLFVVGDSDRVLAQSHQLVINPFHGYPEAERNILDPRLEETIKEFSAIDGAFVDPGRRRDPRRGPLPRPAQQARRAAAAGPGHPPRGRRRHHRDDRRRSRSASRSRRARSRSSSSGRLITDIPKPRGRASEGL